MDIRSITRTAAVIYADERMTRKTDTIKRRFVESVFINNGNTLLTVAELINHIEDKIGLLFSEDEIKKIVKDDEIFMELLNKSSEDIKYNLQEKRYTLLKSRPIDEIDSVIENYLSLQETESIPYTKETLKVLIYRYLHSVLNTNISAYSHFLNPAKTTQIPKLNAEKFEDEEIDIINGFVKWENDTKNKAIFKLINYCIEYAIVVNNSSEDVLSKSLRTKIFYLDNSLIYRALGINGETRKKRALSFLKKCKDSGQEFIISKFTRQEFFNTVDYHLRQLNSSTPFGRISPKTFKRYANGDGFYQFYHEWRNGRTNYSFDVFKTHIHALYKNLIKQFDIKEDLKIPFGEKEEATVVARYKDEIQNIKKTYKDDPHLADARNMYWIECVRKENNYDVASTKYYFVTSDQKLQVWDNEHSKDQPITLLPSQWLGLLLKYVSRSSDDFKSFISFMNLPKDNSVISEDDLQSVMAGISEMTEEFSKQETIIESMVEIKFGDILKGNIQENAKAFAKEKLEQELEKRLEEKEKERINQANLQEQIVSQIKEEAKKIIENNEKKYQEDKLKNINKEIESLCKRRTSINERIDDRRTLLKTLIYGLELLIVIGWIVLILKVGWNKMEMWTYLVGIPCFLLPNLYIAIKGHSINPNSFVEKMCNRYKMKLYDRFDFSETELEELEQMKKQFNKSEQ